MATRVCRTQDLIPGMSVMLGLHLLACADAGEGGGGGGVPAPRFDSVFVIEERVVLEESPAVVNVGIRVVPDPDGGYLIADERESQVRRYADDGTLLWYAGRRGQGPGELQAAVAVARLPSGEVVAGDRSGRLTFFDSSGERVLATVPTGIRVMDGVWVLGPDELLISGHHPEGPMGPRLHVWSVSANEIGRSFFSPLLSTPNRDVSVVVGWSRAALRADTIVATFTTMDTLFFFSREGALHRKVPLPSRYLRVVEADEERLAAVGPRERAEALARFDYVGELQITREGDFLVEYRSIASDGTAWARWHLLGLNPEGDPLFEVRDGPKLLSVAGAGDRFVFQDPEADLPSHWIIARRSVAAAAGASGPRGAPEEERAVSADARVQSEVSPADPALPDPVLQIGQLIRIHRDRDDGREILGVIGRIAGCWAAFYVEPAADDARRWTPVEWETEAYRSARAFVTTDSVYGNDGGRQPDVIQLVEGQRWIELDERFIRERFTGCWP